MRDGEPQTPCTTKRLAHPNGAGPAYSTRRSTQDDNRADFSARRKSTRQLIQSRAEDDDDEDELGQQEQLAEEIWHEAGGSGAQKQDGSVADATSSAASSLSPTADDQAAAQAQGTPSKRLRGRPKGSRNAQPSRRTPTPPRDLPPQELYFFQNRPGTRAKQTSSNTFDKAGVKLLSHDDYLEAMQDYQDPHEGEIEYLRDLHEKQHQKWRWEMEEGYSVCLHGWGSKKDLVKVFAEYMATDPAAQDGELQDDDMEASLQDASPRVLFVNGYAPSVSLREILSCLARTVPSIASTKLSVNYSEAISTIFSALDALNDTKSHGSTCSIHPSHYLLISSLDSPALRRPVSTHTHLARLASHPSIGLLASCDTPNFPLLWDAALRAQFNFAFHDTSTFESFDSELQVSSNTTSGSGFGVVDTVNALLSRSSRKIHGREGVVYVLRSLTESARRLYALLLSEVLSIEDNGDHEDSEGRPASVEYRTLYRNAVKNLIASNEMQFRQLLKEFYDHEMIIATGGAGQHKEALSVPFPKMECLSILEGFEGVEEV